jgi:hypothetical protein
MPLSPEERRLRGQLAAHTRHSKSDPSAQLAEARAALWSRYEREADPAGILDPQERNRRAEQLMHAALARARLASAKQRRLAAEHHVTDQLLTVPEEVGQ